MRTLLGLDRQKIAFQQRRLQQSITIQYQRPLAVEIHRATMEMVNGLRSTGSVPYLPAEHEARVAAIFADLASTTVTAFGERILNDGKARGLHQLERKGFAELFQRLALEYIRAEAIRKKITDIAETTRQRIITRLTRGQEQGQSLDEIATALEATSQRISRVRGALIARTETHGAANHGTHEAAKATGLLLQKEWVSVADTRIRDFNEPIAEFDHRRMDGVTVAMDAFFNVPQINGKSNAIMFPGDPNGHPGNIINCRCQAVHVIPGIE